MPILAGLLLTLFGSLVQIFAVVFAARLAIRLAGIATFTALTIGFLTASGVLLNDLVALFPTDSMLPTVYWLVFPPEVVSTISLVFAFDLSVTLYRVSVRNLNALTAGV